MKISDEERFQSGGEVVASVFVSRWYKAVAHKATSNLKNKLGLAFRSKTYKSYLRFLKSDRVQRMMNFGVFPQRLLWAGS